MIEHSKSVIRTEEDSKNDSIVRSPRQVKGKRRDKVITNITGQASDKLKLNTRLNDAVDDLIKMGNKYRQKPSLVAIPSITNRESLNSKLEETMNVTSSVPDIPVSAEQSSVNRVRELIERSRKVKKQGRQLDKLVLIRAEKNESDALNSNERASLAKLRPILTSSSSKVDIRGNLKLSQMNNNLQSKGFKILASNGVSISFDARISQGKKLDGTTSGAGVIEAEKMSQDCDSHDSLPSLPAQRMTTSNRHSPLLVAQMPITRSQIEIPLPPSSKKTSQQSQIKRGRSKVSRYEIEGVSPQNDNISSRLPTQLSRHGSQLAGITPAMAESSNQVRSVAKSVLDVPEKTDRTIFAKQKFSSLIMKTTKSSKENIEPQQSSENNLKILSNVTYNNASKNRQKELAVEAAKKEMKKSLEKLKVQVDEQEQRAKQILVTSDINPSKCIISKQNQVLTDDKVIEKDDAIEMIQTGQPHMFSSILRCYLTSQHQNDTKNHLGSQSQHRRTCNNVLFTSPTENIPMPQSHFSKVQQNLLARNAKSKQSIFCQANDRKNQMQSNRRNGMKGATTSANSPKSKILMNNTQRYGSQVESRVISEDRYLVPKLKPYRHASQSQYRDSKKFNLQASSEASMGNSKDEQMKKRKRQPPPEPIVYQGQASFAESKDKPAIEATAVVATLSVGNQNSINANDKREQVGNIISNHQDRRIFTLNQAYAKVKSSGSTRCNKIMPPQQSKQRQNGCLIDRSVLQSSEESSVRLHTDIHFHSRQGAQAAQSQQVTPPDFSFRAAQQKKNLNYGTQTAEGGSSRQQMAIQQHRQQQIKCQQRSRFGNAKSVLGNKRSKPESIAKRNLCLQNQNDGGQMPQARGRTEMLPSTYSTTKGLGHKTPMHAPFRGGDNSIRTTYDSLIEPDTSQISFQQELTKIKAKNSGTVLVKNEKVAKAVSESRKQRRNIVIYNQTSAQNIQNMGKQLQSPIQQQPQQKISQNELSDLPEEYSVERPRLQRPAFLSDAKSVGLLLQQQLAGDTALALNQIAKQSKTNGVVSPNAELTKIDLNALRQRFNLDSKLSEIQPMRMRHQPPGPKPQKETLSAEVTIEQQLCQSSIMAMQLDASVAAAIDHDSVDNSLQQVTSFNALDGKHKRVSGGCSN